MILEECKEVFNRSFAQLEKENLSDKGIEAICDIRKAVRSVLTHASEYQDALMLFSRLSNSVVREQAEQDVLANSFWDTQEKNRREIDVVSKQNQAASVVDSLVSEGDALNQFSVRGSGRLPFVARTTEESRVDFESIHLDRSESTEDFKEKFDTAFSGAFKENSDSYVDDVYEDDYSVTFEGNPFIQEEDIDEGIFNTDVYEVEDLPEYAVSMMDDPYLLADELIENLDEEEMDLFIQLGQDENLSEDIVRPSDLVADDLPGDEDMSVDEAVDTARDKFCMPARSRIAMIRGVEPEYSFEGIDLLADGYVATEDAVEPERLIPTEDEIRNAEASWDDEDNSSSSVVFERVDPPEEEYDEDPPIFDADQYGIPVAQPMMMSDEEYEEQHKVDMTTTIAEQAAQAEQYWDKFNKASMIGADIDPFGGDDGNIKESEEK